MDLFNKTIAHFCQGTGDKVWIALCWRVLRRENYENFVILFQKMLINTYPTFKQGE